MTTYRTAPVEGKSESTGVVVIHCADPRYQPHFQDFVRNKLGIPNYALIAVPGGVHFLTPLDQLPEFSATGWRWMKFIVGLTKPRRIILIGHDDCRWYLDSRFVNDASGLRDKVVGDLRRVRDAVRERFPGPTVDLYFARLNPDASATFETI